MLKSLLVMAVGVRKSDIKSRRARGSVKGAVRGVSQSQQRKLQVRRQRFSKLPVVLKCMSFIVLLCLISSGSYYLWLALLAKPVGHVDVEGRFVFVERGQLEELIVDNITEGFLKLDLNALKASLEALEWVDTATVGRQWPDTIKVEVIEHRAIARWGSDAVLNQRGEIIKLSTSPDLGESRQLSQLPSLRGPDEKSSMVMQQYQEMSELLAPHGLTLMEVHCDLAENWDLKLTGGVQLNVGRHQLVEKLGRFLLVYQRQLQARWVELIRVDLRYDNGVAVEWRI